MSRRLRLGWSASAQTLGPALMVVALAGTPASFELPASRFQLPASSVQQPLAAQKARIDASQLMRDVEILAADTMEGRRVGTAGSARAREYILRRFEESGVAPLGGSHEHPFDFLERPDASGSITGTNLLGVIRGRRFPDRYIALSAHYDHIGIRNGQIYNGADDNATGVAALLALAAVFGRHAPDHSILVAALDAEESGLHGATHLVTRGPIPTSAIAVNVNIDMIGRDAGYVLYAAGTYHHPFLRPLLDGAAEPPVRLRLGHDGPNGPTEDWTRDSDHYAFHRAGIPFLYFGVEDHEHHHKPTDDASAVQREFFAAAVATILRVVERIDRRPELWERDKG